MNFKFGSPFVFLIVIVLGEELKSVVEKADTSTLIHVHLTWRHGERNPWNVLPSDPRNSIETWPGGLRQFTRRGMEQNYHLGELLRQRYGQFLSDKFKVEEIYIRSSDKDRTLMAAQSTLAGLYPMDRGIRPVDDLNPIPIHTLPYEQDVILNDRVHCPTAEREEKKIYKSQHFVEFERQNDELLELLGKKSGIGKVPLPLSEVWKVWEPLNGELLHPEAHTKPDWLTLPLWNQISRAYDQYSYGLFDSPLFRRLRSGPLVSKILEQMEQKLKNVSEFEDQKIYAISGHDTTIAGFLRAFDIRPQIFPLFATALFIELHKGEDNQPFIRLFHRNDTLTDDIFELEIPNCSHPCTLDRLKALAQPVIPPNWPLECGLRVDVGREEKDGLNLLFLLCIIFGVLCVLFLSLLIFTLQLYQRQKKYSMPVVGEEKV